MAQMLFILLLIFLGPGNIIGDDFVQRLPVPPLLENKKITLDIQQGKLDLPFGSSSTLGFNGNYLGPTLRFRNGDIADITLNNRINEDTTVHWHGLHVPAEYDGGPHQVIKAGGRWNPNFTIHQPAATLWYHPHLMGKTAEHVYRGLSGMLIIEDDYSKTLNIPMNYGINDFPIILQDRRIDKNGSFSYQPSRPDVMRGYTGNVILVNGAYKPVLDLKKGTYRFRILNGSNSSIYRISFSGNKNFSVIASDGGFLPESVNSELLIISPGERYEILIDFENTVQYELLVEISGGTRHQAMKLSISSALGKFFIHPLQFEYRHADYNVPGIEKRTFNMETRGMGLFTINGKQMDMNRINFKLSKNTDEIWTVRNTGMGMMNILHSFHVHDTQFTVLSFNGRPPDPLLRGPKDTILLRSGEEAVIGVSFKDYTGIYMYHCHLLEHEDSGMMGQFLIE